MIDWYDWPNIFTKIILITILCLCFLMLIFGLVTAFTIEQGTNEYKNQLTKEYLIKFYPEFKDCDVYYFYRGWIMGTEKAKIYCNTIKSKDGLKVMRDIYNQEPDVTLKFSDITFETIEKLKLIEGWGR